MSYQEWAEMSRSEYTGKAWVLAQAPMCGVEFPLLTEVEGGEIVYTEVLPDGYWRVFTDQERIEAGSEWPPEHLHDFDWDLLGWVPVSGPETN